MPSEARMRVPVTVISSSAASVGVSAAVPPASSSAMAPANELEPLRESRACCGLFMAQRSPQRLVLAPGPELASLIWSIAFFVVIADSTTPKQLSLVLSPAGCGPLGYAPEGKAYADRYDATLAHRYRCCPGCG